jgi:hypothetical protein
MKMDAPAKLDGLTGRLSNWSINQNGSAGRLLGLQAKA